MLSKKLRSSINARLNQCDLITLIAVYKTLDKVTERREPSVKMQIVDLLEFDYDESLLEVIKILLIKNN